MTDKKTDKSEDEKQERVWTPAQRDAIEARNDDIIVSAAAGSGKTAVLCERVIRSILGKVSEDKECEPVSISEMLIVTFTKASAEELKSRIAKTIREEIAKTPKNNSYLINQLVLLQSADIGTIHSFCSNLISQNFAELSLQGSVRISEENENDIIALRIMEKTIDNAYVNDAEFPEFVSNFTAASDHALGETLLSIYKKTQNDPTGIDMIRTFALEYRDMDENSWNESRYAKQLCESLISEMTAYINSMRWALDALRAHEKAYKVRGEKYEEDLEYLYGIHKAASRSLSDVSEFVKRDYDPNISGRVTGPKSPEVEQAKEIRDKIVERIKKIREEYAASTKEIIGVCRKNEKFLMTLYRVLYDFEKSFSDEKKRLSLIDFSDLEKMAHKLLVGKNGAPTELALEVSEKYKQIYIDEYQDTNKIQDDIFSAISKNNRFMVGDIKQSIYAFRGAEPSIFADYIERFSDFSEEKSEMSEGKINGKRIFLSNNFRCDRPIIDFSNTVFDTLFRNNSGKIKYRKEDALEYSKIPKEKYDPEKVSVIVAEKDKKCAFYAEAMTVAKEIKSLMKKGVKPDDIAVLVRSFGENTRVFKRVFEKEGIPLDGSGAGNLFENPVVLMLLSMLNCIDNPHRDIWLAGLLSSGLFGITFNDMVDIATSDRGEGAEKNEKRSLYSKLAFYTREKSFEKGERLLAWLSGAREGARSKRVYEIIDDLCRDFAIYATIASDKENAEGSKQYVEIFRDLARNYEGSAFRGLHSFLSYVEDIRNGKVGSGGVKVEVPESKGKVRMMTVHHSKGLEFEYCFVSCCFKDINKQDTKSNFLFSGALGAVVRPVGASGKVRYSSPMYRAMTEHIIEGQIDEEMRILYVALTRARRKLYVTAESGDVDELIYSAEKMKNNYSPYTFRTSSKYILWILASIERNSDYCDVMRSKVSAYEEWLSGEEAYVTYCYVHNDGFACKLLSDGDLSDVLSLPLAEPYDYDTNSVPIEVEEIRDRLEYRYPYEAELSLPAKLAVSRLFPGVLDADAADYTYREERFTDIPKFISANGKNSVSGAMRGTATHVFMQFCDFENAEKNGVEIELARLCDKRFIDPVVADFVYIDKLRAFFNSDLYKEMKTAKNIWREKRFSVMLPASEFTDDTTFKSELSDTKLLVQGVFDCLIERSDGTLKLVDYKTDSLSGNEQRDEEILRARYFTQLSYYVRACELMMGRKISEASIYSFGLGREVVII